MEGDVDDQHSEIIEALPDDDVLDDTPAVAKVLGVSRQWVELSRAKGNGPAYLKLGDGPNSPIRYRRGDVRRWLRSRLKNAAA
jgi:hypothetical protein